MNTILEKDTERFVLRLKSAPDDLKLFLDIIPKEGAPPGPGLTREELVAVIENEGKVKDVDLAVVDDAIKYANRGEAVEERRIKKGREAEPGEPGKLLLLVKKFTGKGEMRPDEDGRISLTSVHLFDNVRNGQVVARVYPPKPGKDGEDVFGRVVPAKPGQPIKVKGDKTVRVESAPASGEAFTRVVALCDGYLTEDACALTVHDELYVKGDVEYHYGNLDFVGKIKISGDVEPGFSVTARLGLIVEGSTREARLRCPEGDIEIKGFVFGGEGGSIVGGKNLVASVMHEVRAEMVGNITVRKEAIDCTLRTQSSIIMPEGRLIGGSSMCVCGAEAKEFGNPAGQETIIALASSVEVSTEYCELLVHIANHDRTLKLIELHLGPYAKNAARIQFLNSEHRVRMEQLMRKRTQVEESRLRLLAKKKAMLEAGRSNAVLRVNYHQALYPGVKIVAGDAAFVAKEQLKGPATIEFAADKGEFVVGEFKAIECSVPGTAQTAAPAAAGGKDATR